MSNTGRMLDILETERLILRRLTLDDADFILELLNDPSFIQFIGDKNVRSVDDARTYILNGPAASYDKFGFGLYLVELKATGGAIGICGLIKREELYDVDLGYAFLPQFRSKGYAVESARGVVAFARQELGLDRIAAITLQDNHDSIRVLERTGFRFEKMVRLSQDGEDLCLYLSDRPL